MRSLAFAFWLLVSTAAAAQTAVPWRLLSTPEEQRLDAAAFVDFDRGIAERLADVQSVVVVLSGRVAYQYHRDGNPEALRDMQSVAKTALVALVGTALRQGQIASLDRQVVDLLPELRPINADPRTQAITLRHLLTMTAGFAVDDATGTAPPLAPAQAWARPFRASPGEVFAYDNSMINLVTATLEKATGRSIADYAREQLVQPLGMIEPSYQRGLHVRTVDMAKLGHLFLQDGVWSGRSLLPPGFAVLATQAVSGGGPPVQLPYGISWWVPSTSTYFASGYAGQFVWVHAPLQAVVAVTSTVSKESQQRGQAMQLIRGRLFQAMQKRAAPSER
jgi:CubicO group peptidase (beta-lactamase class C family)